MSRVNNRRVSLGVATVERVLSYPTFARQSGGVEQALRDLSLLPEVNRLGRTVARWATRSRIGTTRLLPKDGKLHQWLLAVARVGGRFRCLHRSGSRHHRGHRGWPHHLLRHPGGVPRMGSFVVARGVIAGGRDAHLRMGRGVRCRPQSPIEAEPGTAPLCHPCLHL